MKQSDLRPADLAAAAKVTEAQLWYIARNMESCFGQTRRVRSANGKYREIDPPTRDTKKIFRRLHRFLQRSFAPHPSVHGGALGKSCFTSADRHKGKRFVISRDVKDCYPSISFISLRKQLQKFGFRSDTATLMAMLLTLHDRVPQGSPLSSDALNFFLHDADRSIRSVCGRNGLTYSRTYDDLVVSGNSPAVAELPGAVLEREIAKHGLQVNSRKRRKHGRQQSHEQQRVHNLIVNSSRGVRIPPEQVARALAVGDSYVRGARVIGPDSLEGIAYKRSVLVGWICYSRLAHFGPAKHLRRLLEAGDRAVIRKLKGAGLIAYKNKWWLANRTRNEPRRLAVAWRTSA